MKLKETCGWSLELRVLVWVSMVVGFPGLTVQAQETTRQAVVTVEATDAEAVEGGILQSDTGVIVPNTAVFTVHRSGSTDFALDVFYKLSGEAENGVDYRELPGRVTIPVGAATARVIIVPIDDTKAEGPEGVVITIDPPVCIQIYPPPPECYLVGDASQAKAVIRDNDLENQPAKVAIVHPASGDTFPALTDIEINVEVVDPDGWVGLVEFYDGTQKIGEDSIVFIQPPPPGELQRFTFKWPRVAAGRHVLTARATDNRGAKSISEPVPITVGEPCALPIVTLRTIDAYASEQDPRLELRTDPAIFRVCRSCSTEEDLLVRYEVGGTAENGADYETLSGEVLIPAGAECAEIFVIAIDDSLVEGVESVQLTLSKPDCLASDPVPAGCYQLGDVITGTAFIRDDDLPANEPPKIAIVRPPGGSVFLAPVDIRIVAEAADGDGWVEQVEFFADGDSLGVAKNYPWILDPNRLEGTTSSVAPDGSVVVGDDTTVLPINPFFLVWSNAPAGDHVLTAVATDNQGASRRSEPIKISVTAAPEDPVVTIVARDPMAAEGCEDATMDCVDTATFVVHRTGGTENPLRVLYRVGGTAVNGEDYTEIPNSVLIRSGESTATILIEPIDDDLAEGSESVVISLVDPPCLDVDPAEVVNADTTISLGCYQVGRAHTARAVISDNDGPVNEHPVARLLQPQDGDILAAPADIRLVAAASDRDGKVVQVEFFEGENSLGVVTEPTLISASTDGSTDSTGSPGQAVYTLAWPDVPAGRYVLRAVATDDAGALGVSQPVEVKVVSPIHPPVVNIEVRDSVATEQSPYVDALPDPAIFVVSRTGDLERPLVVYYRVGGTARNGEDYERLSGRVIIEAGHGTAAIVVRPLDDEVCEGRESVRIGLVPHDCLREFPPTRDCYAVGENSRARAVIMDDDVCPPNQPPRVAIVRPQDGDTFQAPVDLVLCAEAKDADGRVVLVEFFADGVSLGSASLNSTRDAELFCIRWPNVPAGAHTIVAAATDDGGAVSRSEPVRIRVLERPHLPVVTIRAVDPDGSESGDEAAFAIVRNCCTEGPLLVWYEVGGSASNGEDYEMLTGTATIPAGHEAVRLVVSPIEDDQLEGAESVVVSIRPTLCDLVLTPIPSCYVVGTPARDVVYIRDNESHPNRPPLIALLNPREGSVFVAPADLPLLAAGMDPDGYIPHVDFYAGDRKIGEVTVNFLVPPPPGELQTFEFDWGQVPVGAYTLTVRATDDRGATSISGPIHVMVREEDQLLPAVVTIEAVDALAREGTSNVAIFQVRRTGGNEAESLTVLYGMGGMAENGVDYARLPGSITIPAGHRAARFVVEAREDGLKEGIETVVARLLLPPASSLPGSSYVIGRPGSAAAIIVDPDVERPVCQRLRDGLFHVCLPGSDGTGYRLEVSDNLRDWEEVCLSVIVDGAVHFVDPESSQHPRRFYRFTPATVAAGE